MHAVSAKDKMKALLSSVLSYVVELRQRKTQPQRQLSLLVVGITPPPPSVVGIFTIIVVAIFYHPQSSTQSV